MMEFVKLIGTLIGVAIRYFLFFFMGWLVWVQIFHVF